MAGQCTGTINVTIPCTPLLIDQLYETPIGTFVYIRDLEYGYSGTGNIYGYYYGTTDGIPNPPNPLTPHTIEINNLNPTYYGLSKSYFSVDIVYTQIC